MSLSSVLSIIILHESLEEIKEQLPAEIELIILSDNVLGVINVLRAHYVDINSVENFVDRVNQEKKVVSVDITSIKK